MPTTVGSGLCFRAHSLIEYRVVRWVCEIQSAMARSKLPFPQVTMAARIIQMQSGFAMLEQLASTRCATSCREPFNYSLWLSIFRRYTLIYSEYLWITAAAHIGSSWFFRLSTHIVPLQFRYVSLRQKALQKHAISAWHKTDEVFIGGPSELLRSKQLQKSLYRKFM